MNTVSLNNMFRTWHKVVVILILSWAVIDNCVPGFCPADSPPGAPISNSSVVVSSPPVAAKNVAQPNNLGYSPFEDDCFCCSTHVAPSPHFTLSRSLAATRVIVLVAESHTEDWTPLLYHPPRS